MVVLNSWCRRVWDEGDEVNMPTGSAEVTLGLPTARRSIWNLSALEVGRRARFLKATSLSGQAYAPEKILKAFIRAVSVKNRVDREVSHPNSVIFIGSFQPLECVLSLI
jgi:hypothetical protein